MSRLYRSIAATVVCSIVASIAQTLVAIEPLNAAVRLSEQQRIAAIAKAKKASISVFANGGRGGGSGVVITPDGYALSNFHVTKPAGTFMKCSMPDGELYDAVIVGIDAVGDVALIKLFGRDDFPHATLADSDLVKAGDWCFAIGNPFLLATDFQPTVTYGIVSGVHRYQYPAGTLLEYADCIQTDASINPGNSGGPLFNAEGDLIGINGRGSFEKRGRVNVGVGYAISINQIKHFMGYLRSGRIVDHATMGATVATDEDGRVVVSNILESSDAYRRGLRYGDEIISFGGRPISTVNGFKNVLGIFPKEWRVPLTYRRDDEQVDVLVRLAGVHGSEQLVEKVQGKPKADPKAPGKPAPKEKKDDSQPKDDKQPEPRKIQLPVQAKPPAAPKHLAKFYKARRGFANYHFNELNRDRVWNHFKKHGDFAGLTGTWILKGTDANGGAFELSVADLAAVLQLNGAESAIKTGDVDLLGDQRLPQGSGGFLPALHLWRRLLTLGPQRFGDLFYLGSGPSAAQKEHVDIFVATFSDVEARFQFDPQSGVLVAMEMFPDLGVDPCEIFFGDYRDVEGRQVPHRLEVRFGDREFNVFQVEDVSLKASGGDA